MGIGDGIRKLGRGLETLGKTVDKDFDNAERAGSKLINDVAHGRGKSALGDIKGVGEGVVDGFFDGAAASVGVAELLGVRYGVKSYSSKVSSELTRGSRLNDAQMSDLHAQGYKGVVNLCMENDDDTPRAKALGMNSLHLSILDNTAPSEAQMKQFLDFVTAPQNQPAYVHCEAGQGRTGVAVACYRMAVQGWTLESALADAKQNGLKLPDQIQFLQQFSADLQAGKIAGYPKA